ncbi:ANTAR domain-containing protein [Paenibacillus sp. JX-17]|uniref:ANTAR domain-containing protein n=1 Tax=Paenibacillus lacisoli TaxID=3064525 RepID=A0ABT9CJI2_9BACL|nr:ANTAR domain-containing protein [Paenibacillus sp. JX-17]MDO7907768.1 ANTAR domain-containing protein [Paenibacillus sp. JX-17]
MHSLLVIKSEMFTFDNHSPKCAAPPAPEHILRLSGYQTEAAVTLEQASLPLQDADAFVLYVPISEYTDWRNRLTARKAAPVLWWCCEETSSQSAAACEDDVLPDGILSPSMTELEIHWSLHFSSRHFLASQHWKTEREQLQARIEERKWIDMAKEILSKLRGISESEAYDHLRKQAMNERKRIVDVATSIVKAYQLLHKSSLKG